MAGSVLVVLLFIVLIWRFLPALIVWINNDAVSTSKKVKRKLKK